MTKTIDQPVIDILQRGRCDGNLFLLPAGQLDRSTYDPVNSRPFHKEAVGLGVHQHDLGRWPTNIVLDPEAAQILDEQSGYLESGHTPKRRGADKHRVVYDGWKGQQCVVEREYNGGGASRFFYCAKASQAERGEGNNHPTVKPLALMIYLCRLVTPPGGLVLDLFTGSGTTGCACKKLGFSFVGFDNDPASVAIARRRIADVTGALPMEVAS